MALLLIGLAVGAGFMVHWTTIAIINCVLAVGSNGVIANYGPHEAQLVPAWASFLSVATPWRPTLRRSLPDARDVA
jgi:hypothetical protein